MRLGVVLPPGDWNAIRREAQLLEAAGVDCCLLRAGGSSPTAVAAALAAVTTDLTVLVELECGSHPVGLAEELAVCDLLLGGRLAAVVTGDDADVVTETLDVLAHALARRRFRHDGARWRFPVDPQATITVTPGPAQLALPVWVGGASFAAPARRRALPWLAPLPEAAVAGASGVVRSVRLTERGALDGVAEELSKLQRAEGVVLCVLDLLDAPGERPEAIRLVGSRLRPRLQGSDLPPDLVASWDQPSRSLRT
jgi:hypothetical protein